MISVLTPNKKPLMGLNLKLILKIDCELKVTADITKEIERSKLHRQNANIIQQLRYQNVFHYCNDLF